MEFETETNIQAIKVISTSLFATRNMRSDPKPPSKRMKGLSGLLPRYLTKIRSSIFYQKSPFWNFDWSDECIEDNIICGFCSASLADIEQTSDTLRSEDRPNPNMQVII